MQIAREYFLRWAKIMINARKRRGMDERIAYMDLYAGRGRYRDGTASTPLQILQTALGQSDIRSRLLVLFNEGDQESYDILREEVSKLPDIGNLTHEPKFTNDVLGNEIKGKLTDFRDIPTFVFVDPWGYKGISLNLLYGALKNWGCDCLFFFNYNRINPAVENPKVEDEMVALFGKERVEELRSLLAGKTPLDREKLIINELTNALREIGSQHSLGFKFLDEHGTRTSHYLILVTKHPKGLEKAKEVFSRASSRDRNGFPSMVYNPFHRIQPELGDLSVAMSDLQDELLEQYHGKKLTVSDIYKDHGNTSPYLIRNYMTAIRDLKDQGAVTVEFQASPKTGKVVRRLFHNSLIVFPEFG